MSGYESRLQISIIYPHTALANRDEIVFRKIPDMESLVSANTVRVIELIDNCQLYVMDFIGP